LFHATGEGADPALIALLAAAGKSAAALPSDLSTALAMRKVCAGPKLMIHGQLWPLVLRPLLQPPGHQQQPPSV
jgi:hypothetical protein